MTLRNILVSLGIAASLALGIVALVRPQSVPPAGAVSGGDVYNTMYLHGDLIVGGTTVASTSQGTATYTVGQMINNRLITQTAAAALTETLPASTTFGGYLPIAGDSKTTCINAVTTKVTIAAGTGIILSVASTSAQISAGQIGCITFVRKANTDVSALLVAD